MKNIDFSSKDAFSLDISLTFVTIFSGITKYHIQKAPGISKAKEIDFCTSMAVQYQNCNF